MPSLIKDREQFSISFLIDSWNWLYFMMWAKKRQHSMYFRTVSSLGLLSALLVYTRFVSSVGRATCTVHLKKSNALKRGLLYGWTEHSGSTNQKYVSWGRANSGPILHPKGGFFGPWYFIILKHLLQDLSNEGSNFILSSLKVGHWVAQT